MAFLSCFSSPLVNPNWGDSCRNITFHWREGGIDTAYFEITVQGSDLSL